MPVQKLRRLKNLEVSEISLVDNPAVSQSKFVIVKRDDGTAPVGLQFDHSVLNEAARILLERQKETALIAAAESLSPRDLRMVTAAAATAARRVACDSLSIRATLLDSRADDTMRRVADVQRLIADVRGKVSQVGFQ